MSGVGTFFRANCAGQCRLSGADQADISMRVLRILTRPGHRRANLL